MKKLFVIASVGMLMFTTSCKKVYTCACTVGSITVSTDLDKMTKKDAKEKCDSGDSAFSSCELK